MEFGKSREQGKHREQDEIKWELQETPVENCRKFQEMVLQQPALIKGREEIGQGESGSEARPTGLLNIWAPGQLHPKDPPNLVCSCFSGTLVAIKKTFT